MSRADELLDALSDDEIVVYTADPTTEEHIIINNDRFIIVPESLKRIAVQFDNNVETVTFDCPRYWDGLDMSKMKIYINYLTKNNVRGMYWADNVTIDEEDDRIMHFDWTISRNVTLVKGNLSFLVCIKKTDSEGLEENHWNSELNQDMYVSEGLECEESIVDAHPDIITDLLTRMDYVEYIATPETMQNYVSEFLSTTDELRNITYDFMETLEPTSPESMLEYVHHYLNGHPPLFVIGPEKPGVRCLWFDTSESGDTSANVYIKAVATNPNEQLYAVVDDIATTDYSFDIE